LVNIDYGLEDKLDEAGLEPTQYQWRYGTHSIATKGNLWYFYA